MILPKSCDDILFARAGEKHNDKCRSDILFLSVAPVTNRYRFQWQLKQNIYLRKVWEPNTQKSNRIQIDQVALSTTPRLAQDARELCQVAVRAQDQSPVTVLVNSANCHLNAQSQLRTEIGRRRPLRHDESGVSLGWAQID